MSKDPVWSLRLLIFLIDFRFNMLRSTADFPIHKKVIVTTAERGGFGGAYKEPPALS